jgi:hypothetical protein
MNSYSEGNKITTSNPTFKLFFSVSRGGAQSVDTQISWLEFVKLDDSDVWTVLKDMQDNSDEILSSLAQRILARKFYKVTFSPEKYQAAIDKLPAMKNEEEYYTHFSDMVTVTAYSSVTPIRIATKDHGVMDYEDYIIRNGMIIPLENYQERRSFALRRIYS